MKASRNNAIFFPSEKSRSADDGNAGNSSVAARNLSKSDLGGVIFGCKHNTINECLSNQLFGLPGPHFSYIRKIEPGLPLFLFNYSDRKLHGIFEAAGYGQMNIDPYAWTEEGNSRTAFPAQVRIFTTKYCKPLKEALFRPIISDNYYTSNHFYFELDHSQTRTLLSLFTPNSSPVSSKDAANLAQIVQELKERVTSLEKTQAESEEEVEKLRKVAKECCFATQFLKKHAMELEATLLESASPPEQLKNSADVDEVSTTPGVPTKDSEENPEIAYSSSNDTTEMIAPVLDTTEAELKEEVEGLRKEAKECCLTTECMKTHATEIEVVQLESALPSKQLKDSADVEEVPSMPEVPAKDSEEIPEIAYSPSNDTAPILSIAELVEIIEELKERVTLLEKQQRKFNVLNNLPAWTGFQAASQKEVEELRKVARECCQAAQYMEHAKRVDNNLFNRDSSSSLTETSTKETTTGMSVLLDSSVYIIGGFDGDSWLSSLDSYSLSLDLMTPLCPMTSARSYASATSLDGSLYVFGGGDGSLWYDTVECYDIERDEWRECPPLVQGKGSLAGATLNGKIFAIGGGNGCDVFADLEMMDPLLGRWIKHHSMLQKRMALGAAELGGALYSVGGFNGDNYLRTCERFDPREGIWTKIASMKTSRGCHSMAVLDDKLYAVGGYDGDGLSSGVEVYDPRAESWYIGGDLNMARGFAAAVVFDGSLYTFGGLTADNVVLDEVCAVSTSISIPWPPPPALSLSLSIFISTVIAVFISIISSVAVYLYRDLCCHDCFYLYHYVYRHLYCYDCFYLYHYVYRHLYCYDCFYLYHYVYRHLYCYDCFYLYHYVYRHLYCYDCFYLYHYVYRHLYCYDCFYLYHYVYRHLYCYDCFYL
ncbi:influenza virus NS1A-binding protein [Wolffia australiana]